MCSDIPQFSVDIHNCTLKGGKENEKEKGGRTCKWTGVNLNVTKSQTGQYMTPLIIVGSKSRFNRATISAMFSPVWPSWRLLKTILNFNEVYS